MIEIGQRTRLSERLNSAWTPFETQLFNMMAGALQAEAPDLDRVLFSKRLWVTEELLEAFDTCVSLLRSGHKAREGVN